MATFLLIGALSMMLPGTVAADGAASAKIMLLVDGSRSMWGRMDGQEKITVARNALGSLADQWPGSESPGLVGLGHRQEHDCNDVQTLYDRDQLDTAEFKAALRQIRPTGFTPLGAALRHLADGPQPLTAVIITDGFGSCDIDLCGVGRQLADNGAAIRTHVIGLQVDDAQVDELSCLAHATGGTYQQASSTGALAAALTTLLESASQPVIAKSVAASASLPQTTGSQGEVLLSARLFDGSSRLAQGLTWKIFAADAPPGSEPVATSGAAAPLVALAPGRYRVRTKLDNLRASSIFEVRAAKRSEVSVDFDAGLAFARARMRSSTPPLAKGVVWTVSRANRDGTYSMVTRTDEAEPRFMLERGKYRLTARAGHAEIGRTFSVQPGSSLLYDMVFDAGRLQLSAVGIAGEQVRDDVLWTIYRKDKDTTELQEVASTREAQPNLTLAKGHYVVQLERRGKTVRRDSRVRAGELLVDLVSLAGATASEPAEAQFSKTPTQAPEIADRS